MVQILDDEHLESLQCSRCRKYLSVFPVKNHSNRDVTCGRCSGIDADEDDSVRSTLYKLVAEKYLFKCVNRFEGCRKLLRADETEDHEKECVGNVFNCPKCEDGIERSVLELIWHYKLQHPSSYLKKNCLDVKLPISNDIMLYVQDDVMFFIFVRCDLNILQLCATTLTEVNVTQMFQLKKGAVWERNEKTPCKVISAFNGDYCQVFNLDAIESVQVIFNLEVSKQSGKLYDVSVLRSEVGLILNATNEKTFRIRLSETKMDCKLKQIGTASLVNENGEKIDFTCSNCKQLIGLPVYRCYKSKHQICGDCWAWCGICDSFVDKCGTNDLLNQVSKYLMFPCRWKCGNYFSSNLKNHEKSCKLRVFKCSICSLEIESLDLLKKHLLNNHEVLNFCGDYDIGVIVNLIEKKKNGELAFLLHNICCYLKWFQNSNNSCYDFHFGLFSNEPNVKLGIMYELEECFYNIMKNINIQLKLYAPYMNFNYMK